MYSLELIVSLGWEHCIVLPGQAEQKPAVHLAAIRLSAQFASRPTLRFKHIGAGYRQILFTNP